MTEDVQELDTEMGRVRLTEGDADPLAKTINGLVEDPWVMLSVPKNADHLSMVFRGGNGVRDSIDMLIVLDGAVEALRFSLAAQDLDVRAEVKKRLSEENTDG